MSGTRAADPPREGTRCPGNADDEDTRGGDGGDEEGGGEERYVREQGRTRMEGEGHDEVGGK